MVFVPFLQQQWTSKRIDEDAALDETNVVAARVIYHCMLLRSAVAGALFSPSVYYTLSVRLHFADIEQGNKLGVFQSILSIYDGDHLLKTYTKASYLKEPTLVTKMIWVLFFPLYFVGMFHNYNILDIPFATEHIETYGRSSSKLVFQLQDRRAQLLSLFKTQYTENTGLHFHDY
ncbi:putative adipose-regulatory protein [Cooperia oncophora]